MQAAANGQLRKGHKTIPHASVRSAVACAADARRKALNIQRAIYNCLFENTMRIDLPSYFAAKAVSLFGGTPPDGLKICRQLRRLSPQDALNAIRFLTNGWTTAARMHSAPIPCLFCNEHDGDDMQHYLKCSALRHELANVFGVVHLSAESSMRLLSSVTRAYFTVRAQRASPDLNIGRLRRVLQIAQSMIK